MIALDRLHLLFKPLDWNMINILTTAGLNGNPDIELEQSYYPAHADMDMAQGTGCSSPETMNL